jgi:hypothetical protein
VRIRWIVLIAFEPGDKINMSTPERITAFQKLIERLPLPHQFLLLYLLDMLSIFAQNDQANLMTASNLAAIFTPGMLSHPSHDLDPVQYKISQRVVEFLIEFHMCFNMPHATALHKDPVMHPSAAHAVLPPHANTPQEVVLNDTQRLNQKASTSTLGSQRSTRTITQAVTQNKSKPVAEMAASLTSFATPDALSMSVASSIISSLDKPPTPQDEALIAIGSASTTSGASAATADQITPKAMSTFDLLTANCESISVASVPDQTHASMPAKRDNSCKFVVTNLRLSVSVD